MIAQKSVPFMTRLLGLLNGVHRVYWHKDWMRTFRCGVTHIKPEGDVHWSPVSPLPGVLPHIGTPFLDVNDMFSSQSTCWTLRYRQIYPVSVPKCKKQANVCIRPYRHTRREHTDGIRWQWAWICKCTRVIGVIERDRHRGDKWRRN